MAEEKEDTDEQSTEPEQKQEELKQEQQTESEDSVDADTADSEGEETETLMKEEEIPEEDAPIIEKKLFDTSGWIPKTEVGKKVKAGEITDIDDVLNSGKRLLEAEVVDVLLPDLESDLLLIGQSKGKFGGGQRRVFRQTQKKTKEGNKPSFATFAVVGDHKGHVGIGYGKSKETVPAREKAFRRAKLNITKIRRGCGSWQCRCKDSHSIPFKVEGKCGSVQVKLMPAPKGTGLCAGSETAKILKMAGVSDVWCKTAGKTTSRVNLVIAVIDALNNLVSTKIKSKHIEELNIMD